jgi:hypothetical protein
MRIVLVFVAIISVNSIAQVQELSCDDYLKLQIDIKNLTEEEIIQLKAEYFNKSLAIQSVNCISQRLGTSEMQGMQGLESSAIQGSDLTIERSSANDNQSNAALANNSNALNENETIASLANNTQPNQQQNSNNKQNIISENGNVPECLRSYNNNSELSKLLAEAIAEETDQSRKNELVKRYAQINGLKSEEILC